MNYSNPVQSLQSSIADALMYFQIRFKGMILQANELDIYLFQQTWSSTALGFGGLGGRAMSRADTTVVRYGNTFRVYFNGRFAYQVEGMNPKFVSDLQSFKMASVHRSAKYQA